MSRRLPKTLTNFDGLSMSEERCEDLYPAVASTTSTAMQQRRAVNILIESLVEELCCFYQTDPQKQSDLFQYICNNLSRLQFIAPQTSHPDRVKLKFRNVFRNFITVSVQQCEYSANNSLVPRVSTLSNLFNPEILFNYCNLMNGDIIFHNSRYKHDFEQEEQIASGAFGVVCKAWRKVDQVFYAVKKIPFKFLEDPLFEKIINEVKYLAQINHPNVVGYKTAWIEPPGEMDPSLLDMFESSGETDFESKEENFSMPENDTEEYEQHNSIIFESNCTVSSSAQYTVKSEQNCRVQKLTIVEKSNQQMEKYENYYDEPITKSCSCQISSVDCHIHKKHSEEHFYNSVTHANHYQRSYSTAEESQDNCAKGQFKPKSSSSDPSDKAIVRHAYRRSSSNTDVLIQVNGASRKTDRIKCKAILYVQMELCQESLRQWLDRRSVENRPVDILMAKNILKQVLKGVEYIHSRSLIHRDLKPQNILFNDTAVKIGDFGLATICCSQHEAGGGDACTNNPGLTQGVGTSPYAAPEQRANNTYGPKADMYSMGVILLELMYSFNTSMELYRYFERSGHLSHLPNGLKEMQPEVAEMIERLTQFDPNNRPSASEVLKSDLFLSKSQSKEEVLTQRNIFLEKRHSDMEKEIANLKSKLREYEKS